MKTYIGSRLRALTAALVPAFLLTLMPDGFRFKIVFTPDASGVHGKAEWFCSC